MIGPEGVALAITQHLEAHLDAKVTELTARFEAFRLPMVERELLRPKLVAPFDVLDLAVGDYPAALVVVKRLRKSERVDIADTAAEAGQPVYRNTYPVWVMLWARGRTGVAANDLQPEDGTARPGAGADRNRKRLILATREILLEHQALTITLGNTPELDPVDDGYRAGYTVAGTVVESTLAEDYSDVVVDDVGTVAAGAVMVDVQFFETTPPNPAPIIQTARTINVDLIDNP